MAPGIIPFSQGEFSSCEPSVLSGIEIAYDVSPLPSNLPEWIAKLRPLVVLLSVGMDGKRILPSPETTEIIQGYPLLRTDRNGWIEITTDGERMWVEAERR